MNNINCFACVCLILLCAACTSTLDEQVFLIPELETSNNFEYVFDGFHGIEPDSEPCGDAKIDEVWLPAEKNGDSVFIDCDLNLEFDPDRTITRKLILEGESASGVEINCNDNTIEGGKSEDDLNFKQDMIEVGSHFDEETGTFTRPENILIRNCNIIGSIRVWGMGKNGEGNGLEKDGKEINPYKDSSETAGHTERARNNAPTNITFDNIVITGVARNPFYLAPGVTNARLINSELKGSSDAVALYLDAESSGNIIRSKKKRSYTPKSVPKKREKIVTLKEAVEK